VKTVLRQTRNKQTRQHEKKDCKCKWKRQRQQQQKKKKKKHRRRRLLRTTGKFVRKCEVRILFAFENAIQQDVILLHFGAYCGRNIIIITTGNHDDTTLCFERHERTRIKQPVPST
jgi:hypothetical protein